MPETKVTVVLPAYNAARTLEKTVREIPDPLVQNILVANASMSDETAYNIVKTFIEKQPELVAVHGEAKSITLQNQLTKNSPLPWHPGAVKYFKEKGVKM